MNTRKGSEAKRQSPRSSPMVSAAAICLVCQQRSAQSHQASGNGTAASGSRAKATAATAPGSELQGSSPRSSPGKSQRATRSLIRRAKGRDTGDGIHSWYSCCCLHVRVPQQGSPSASVWVPVFVQEPPNLWDQKLLKENVTKSSEKRLLG